MKDKLKSGSVLRMRDRLKWLTKLLISLAFFIMLHASCLICCACAAPLSTISSGPWSSPLVWSSGAAPQDGDTAIVSAGDSVWLDTSTAMLASLVVNGSLGFGTDTLFIESSDSISDTIKVNGTLDAGSGWFAVAGNIRPVVHLATGSLFRTSATFPYSSPSIFDSAQSPLFICDSMSTFEYYSKNLALIDISYLTNNIIGNAYSNLTLTKMNASFRANPIQVLGTFHIGLGATVNPAAGRGGSQQITIFGDVINNNGGDDRGSGAGPNGPGMFSSGSDEWVFGDTIKTIGKDTCHWSGPSQLGSVIIRPNTVLAVRFIDDTHCDSLDILGRLTEEDEPCGGHLIGRVFSEFAPTRLDSLTPVDSFFGLTIKSGTDPYLGLTRVVRTSGYLPPGTSPPSQQQLSLGEVNPVLRYYSITTGAGPQLGDTNKMSFQVHCDELNGNDPSKLHFWRSRDRGGSWAFSGISSYDANQDIFVWDTSTLCFPNDTGSFYWMLSAGYTDSPTPVELESFNVCQSGSDMLLTWQTTSAINIAGYEIERSASAHGGATDSEMIATFATDDSLRSHSNYGASYAYSDAVSYSGPIRYDLYEVTNDGISQWLGSKTVRLGTSITSSPPFEISYSNGSLVLTSDSDLDFTITVSDELGRTRYYGSVLSPEGDYSIPLQMPSGFYFATCRWHGGQTTQKILVVMQ